MVIFKATLILLQVCYAEVCIDALEERKGNVSPLACLGILISASPSFGFYF